MAVKDALGVIEETFDEFAEVTGRRYHALESEGMDDADIALLGMGSMMQTTRLAAQQLRDEGRKVGVLTLRSFRPFPEEALRKALAGVGTVIVLDRDIGYGTAGMVYPDVTRALYHTDARPRALNCVIGLGGKDITPKTILRCVELGGEDHGDQTVFWPDARGPKEGIPWTGEQAPAGAGR
jgi:pyruvate ferredoxin oxidoreductase alpha subunit